MTRQPFPKVTVSVTNVRGTVFLEQRLQALTKTDYPDLEIIIIDCQTSQISEWIRRRFSSVKAVLFGNDIGLQHPTM